LTLFPIEEPQAKLRIARATPNNAARLSQLRFDRNLEVPSGSAIARLFPGPDAAASPSDAAAVKSLTLWKHSDGEVLGSTTIRIEARQLNDFAFALVQPA